MTVEEDENQVFIYCVDGRVVCEEGRFDNPTLASQGQRLRKSAVYQILTHQLSEMSVLQGFLGLIHRDLIKSHTG